MQRVEAAAKTERDRLQEAAAKQAAEDAALAEKLAKASAAKAPAKAAPKSRAAADKPAKDEKAAAKAAYFGKRIAATVTAEPLFDPGMERLRG